MIQFLDIERCKEAIEDGNSNGWKRAKDVYEYDQAMIKLPQVHETIISKFESIKNVKVEYGSNWTRILKLGVGDKLPTHTFDYSREYKNKFRDTNFGIVTFLNDNYEGGNYYINSKKVKTDIGYGYIHNKTSTGKLTEITSGECYLLITHIFHLDKRGLLDKIKEVFLTLP